ncbi:unnamed protein product [Cyprideis torosa]|uniref:Uncharacterized protein n=1 Tax=Cyprideis torosa TaxID=163714 RepID=A0A7R8WLJ3_9CRUS|nr:unnamed protein product [Cyprideis torosa]CAG0904406.1 unnamed protein product [Cyprideis torosa]
MRDYETISLALTAAETGHLVFATLHANTAAKTVDRIIDVFPTGDKEMVRAMLSNSLEGVIAQTLVQKAGGVGRVGAFEVLVGTNAVRNLIRENQVPQIYSMMQTGSRYGMITMEESINNLLEEGVIGAAQARTVLMRAGDEGIGSEFQEEDRQKEETSKVAAASSAEGKQDEEGYSF